MAEPEYTQDQLRLLIQNADRLGYYDDMIHWEKKLNELQNKEMVL